jgi:hypothetical protein
MLWFSSLYDAIHGWMTGRMGHVMKKTSQKTTTTSFTVCNKGPGEPIAMSYAEHPV